MSSTSTGVAFRPTSTPERLWDVIEAVEAAGVAELWLWEDCFAHGGLASAALALAWTERLQIGIGLIPVGLRNPALLAMEIATLARLFPDRFIPGLGHGPPDPMAHAGVHTRSPMGLLREHTTAIRALLHGERVDTHGLHVQLDGVTLDWPPTTAPALLMGARGPKTLRLAGELADGVILDSIATPEELRAALAEVDIGRAATGRDGPFRVVVYVEPPAGPPPDELADIVAGWIADLGAAGATSVVFVNSPHAPDPMPLLTALTSRRSAVHQEIPGDDATVSVAPVTRLVD